MQKILVIIKFLEYYIFHLNHSSDFILQVFLSIIYRVYEITPYVWGQARNQGEGLRGLKRPPKISKYTYEE